MSIAIAAPSIATRRQNPNRAAKRLFYQHYHTRASLNLIQLTIELNIIQFIDFLLALLPESQSITINSAALQHLHYSNSSKYKSSS